MSSRHHQEHPPVELELDAILSSPDPEIKRNYSQFMHEEMSLAQERALMRVAVKYSSLLPPAMQNLVFREARAMQVCHG